MNALPPFLTDEEIAAITHPLTQGAARIRYLRGLGIKVDPRPDGQPHVGRAEYEAARMDRKRASAAPAQAGGNVIAPDWEQLRAAGGRPRRA